MSEKDRSAPHLSSLNLDVPKKPLERNLIFGASGQVGGALVEALGIQNWHRNVRKIFHHFNSQLDPELFIGMKESVLH